MRPQSARPQSDTPPAVSPGVPAARGRRPRGRHTPVSDGRPQIAARDDIGRSGSGCAKLRQHVYRVFDAAGVLPPATMTFASCWRFHQPTTPNASRCAEVNYTLVENGTLTARASGAHSRCFLQGPIPSRSDSPATLFACRQSDWAAPRTAHRWPRHFDGIGFAVCGTGGCDQCRLAGRVSVPRWWLPAPASCASLPDTLLPREGSIYGMSHVPRVSEAEVRPPTEPRRSVWSRGRRDGDGQCLGGVLVSGAIPGLIACHAFLQDGGGLVVEPAALRGTAARVGGAWPLRGELREVVNEPVGPGTAEARREIIAGRCLEPGNAGAEQLVVVQGAPGRKFRGRCR